MTATLVSLVASGPGKDDARIDFGSDATLVRGPSETGKSYIRDCLWYLLGGEKVPKKIPQAVGYNLLTLVLVADGQTYEFRRGLSGGDATITQVKDPDSNEFRTPVDLETGDLLVALSGAEGKQLLRSRSKRGGVTGGDLRHWFLISQPNIISEEATSGVGTNAPQRIAAFHLFLTGNDDSAIELAKSNAELDRIGGQIVGAEQSLKRVRAELPTDDSREEIADALEKVDTALEAMTQHYNARAAGLKEIREGVLHANQTLQTKRREHDLSYAMVERFELLDEKYRSDSERLGATWEGVSMFQALEETPCPLCGTPVELQVDPRQLRQGTQEIYRRALRVELDKIGVLRTGLSAALASERNRVDVIASQMQTLNAKLSLLEQDEQRRVSVARVEFSGNPKELALRRSELSEWLSRFEEEARLIAEIERLAEAKQRKRTPLSRNVGTAAIEVASRASALVKNWGFTNIQSISLDADVCDLVIDGRSRLDYGAGKRAIFLTALTVAMMMHALENGYPHVGFVLLDSPLKSYADPKVNEQRDVAPSTVTDHFYDWLSRWNGPGQVVVLENQDIQNSARSRLRPIEFVGDAGDEGRQGFYP